MANSVDPDETVHPKLSFLLDLHCLHRYPCWSVGRKGLMQLQTYITKTCLYNVDPLKPHFYIVKVGFTRVYIIFLISAQNIDCG